LNLLDDLDDLAFAIVLQYVGGYRWLLRMAYKRHGGILIMDAHKKQMHVPISSVPVLEFALKNKWFDVEKAPAVAARGGVAEVLQRALDMYASRFATSIRLLRPTSVCLNAAASGDIATLRCARENGCPWGVTTCASAAFYGHLELLKYARREGCPWDPRMVCDIAADHGHVDLLEYVIQEASMRDRCSEHWLRFLRMRAQNRAEYHAEYWCVSNHPPHSRSHARGD
jgi:hypothetical protein